MRSGSSIVSSMSCNVADRPRHLRVAVTRSVIKSSVAMTLNAYLIKSTVVAALGGLLFGFDTAVIAGATHALTELYRLSPASLGLTVASALFGTILGAMFAGIPADLYGRRDSLRLMAILY